MNRPTLAFGSVLNYYLLLKKYEKNFKELQEHKKKPLWRKLHRRMELQLFSKRRKHKFEHRALNKQQLFFLSSIQSSDNTTFELEIIEQGFDMFWARSDFGHAIVLRQQSILMKFKHRPTGAVG